MEEHKLHELMISMGSAVNEKVSKDLYNIIKFIIFSFILLSIIILSFIFVLMHSLTPHKTPTPPKPQIIEKIVYKERFTSEDIIDIKHIKNRKCIYYRKQIIAKNISEFYTICK